MHWGKKRTYMVFHSWIWIGRSTRIGRIIRRFRNSMEFRNFFLSLYPPLCEWTMDALFFAFNLEFFVGTPVRGSAVCEFGRFLRVLCGPDRAGAPLTSRVRPAVALQVGLMVILWPASTNGRNKPSPIEWLLSAFAACAGSGTWNDGYRGRFFLGQIIHMGREAGG